MAAAAKSGSIRHHSCIGGHDLVTMAALAE
jgi:hypothetical protein